MRESAQALDPEDWRAFLVDVLRSYVDFLEPTREAESFEKYRAPLLSWWEALTEERRRIESLRALGDQETWRIVQVA